MAKLLKRLGYLLLSVLALLIVFAGFNYKKIQRLLHVNSLFEKEKILNNFLTMEQAFPVSVIPKSDSPTSFTYKKSGIPQSFISEDSTVSTPAFMDYTQTTGLLILHRDTIRFEEYYRGNTANTTHISWSMAKSFVSALVGIAIEEGKIGSVDEPITKYVPDLKGSGYDGVRIKDILQMSSGVRFDEDYVDFNSDINRFGRSFALGLSFDKFCTTLVNEREPGTYNHYVSIDTQVLGMLLKRATGMSLSQYLTEKIWHPLGMEHEAQWITDDTGMEAAFGGLNVVLRDYARFGELYLHGGKHGDQQIVPAEWVRASTTPDAPHLQAGENPASSNPRGYGYQWWVPKNADGAFMAQGVYNQNIFIYPKKDLVIVKTSANPRYDRDGDHSSQQSIDFFWKIAEGFPFVGESNLAEVE